MKMIEGAMLFEVTHLPTEDDVREEFEKLKNTFRGKRQTWALQNYIFDELMFAVKKKIGISSTHLTDVDAKNLSRSLSDKGILTNGMVRKLIDIEMTPHIYRGMSRPEAEIKANQLMEVAMETGQYGLLLKHLEILVERIEQR